MTKLASLSRSSWSIRAGAVVRAELGCQDQNFAPTTVPSMYHPTLGTEKRGWLNG